MKNPKQPSDKATKFIIAFLILQTVGGLFIAGFLYNFIVDPQSEFNRNIATRIQNLVSSVEPIVGNQGLQGAQGEQGLQGVKGDDGQSVQGKPGQDGTDGKDGSNGTDGQPGATGQKGDTGEKGDRGEKGDTGDEGPRAEFRCNDEGREQYIYPGDEDWTDTGAACIPVGGNENGAE